MYITKRLNGMALSREELQDNLLLWYVIVTLTLPTECDGCGYKLLVPHNLPCLKEILVLAQHNNATKEWGAISDRALNP